MPMATRTDLYINNFINNHSFFTPTEWMHDHPEMVKTLQIASIFFALALFVTTPWTVALLGAEVIVTADICGVVALLASIASWLFLTYGTCARHEITEHAYQEAQWRGSRLYYRGHVPILEFDAANTPYDSGFAHGYLLGQHIHQLRSNFEWIMHSIRGEPRAAEVSEWLEAFRRTIPEDYLEEMRGLTEGYALWATQSGIESAITIEDLILFHLVPDSQHFRLGRDAVGLATPACTGILCRDTDQSVIFGRNMDWLPFGDGGGKSLIFVWKNKNVALLGLPGMIGVVTGWNRDGVCLAMNVCPGQTNELRGLPAVFYNRMILENAHSVQDVRDITDGVGPLGAYHLTVADRVGDAACFSFYQDEGEAHHVRNLQNEPVFVVNWRYPECDGGTFDSCGRTRLLTEYFGQADQELGQDLERRKLVENALRISPRVNSWITLHSLLFLPSQDEVHASWDNGFAASMPKQRIGLTEVFN
jgi:predicted choloylglycine hydrolase